MRLTPAEHRIITQGPRNMRDWRITCLCLTSVIGNGAKDAKAKWLEHVEQEVKS